jgi:hypothetical protein
MSIDFDKEMRAALEADGKKLRELTGEDHGPVFLVDLKLTRYDHEYQPSLYGVCKQCGRGIH